MKTSQNMLDATTFGLRIKALPWSCGGEIMWCFIVFHPHCATLLYWYWYWWFWVGLLFAHYSLSRLPPPSPPNSDEPKWAQPPSRTQQLGVTNIKAQHMNNQTDIFSFSSSCFWPHFMIVSPSLPPSTLLPLFLANRLISLVLSKHLSPSRSLQIAELYKKQQQIQNQGDKADPEDYYWSSVVISRE